MLRLWLREKVSSVSSMPFLRDSLLYFKAGLGKAFASRIPASIYLSSAFFILMSRLFSNKSLSASSMLRSAPADAAGANRHRRRTMIIERIIIPHFEQDTFRPMSAASALCYEDAGKLENQIRGGDRPE